MTKYASTKRFQVTKKRGRQEKSTNKCSVCRVYASFAAESSKVIVLVRRQVFRHCWWCGSVTELCLIYLSQFVIRHIFCVVNVQLWPVARSDLCRAIVECATMPSSKDFILKAILMSHITTYFVRINNNNNSLTTFWRCRRSTAFCWLLPRCRRGMCLGEFPNNIFSLKRHESDCKKRERTSCWRCCTALVENLTGIAMANDSACAYAYVCEVRLCRIASHMRRYILRSRGRVCRIFKCESQNANRMRKKSAEK